MQKWGSEGGRRGYIRHTHIQSCMAISRKPSARLTHDLKLITGQRFLRFSILKETPHAPADVGIVQKHVSTQSKSLFLTYLDANGLLENKSHNKC
jgi:hypothetical protein